MRSLKFAQFQAEVLSLYEPPIRAKGTWRQMRQVLTEFAKLSGIKTTADLGAPAIAAWIRAYPDRTPVRAASLLRSLSAACTYAAKAGYLRFDPFDFRGVNDWVRADVIAPDHPQAARYQTRESIERLLGLVDTEASEGGWKAGRRQALVYLLAFTGLRKGEALNLKTFDVDLGARVITIAPRRTFRPKTKKSAARIPLAEPAAQVLALWLPRTGCDWVFPGVELKGPWLGGCPGYKPLDEVRAAGERAGITGLTIASFRKTIGTLAKRWGMGQLELKALLRHTNVQTQEWYDEAAVDELRPAVAKIQFRVASNSA